MGQALTRIAPNLRAIGITWTKKGNDDRSYRFTVQSPETAPDTPEAPKPAPHKGFRADSSPANAGGPAHGRTEAPESKPQAPVDTATKNNDLGVSGAKGASFPDCTTTTAKEFTGSRRGLI
jgi:hypothetical protein